MPYYRILLRILFIVAAVLGMIGLSNCAHSGDGAGSVKQYQLQGQIVRMDPRYHVVAVKHQKIDGWMEAMTTEFPVKNKEYFRSLHTGDSIKATFLSRTSIIGSVTFTARRRSIQRNSRSEER